MEAENSSQEVFRERFSLEEGRERNKQTTTSQMSRGEISRKKKWKFCREN